MQVHQEQLWNDEPRLVEVLKSKKLLGRYLSNLGMVALLHDHNAGQGRLPPCLLQSVQNAAEDTLEEVCTIRRQLRPLQARPELSDLSSFPALGLCSGPHTPPSRRAGKDRQTFAAQCITPPKQLTTPSQVKSNTPALRGKKKFRPAALPCLASSAACHVISQPQHYEKQVGQHACLELSNRVSFPVLGCSV